MPIKIYPTYEQLSIHAAALIVEYVNQKPDALICVASGHTPIGVFQQLQHAVERHEVRLGDCTFLSLDEWVGIEPSDSGSCTSMLHRDCFGPLNIQADKIQFFNVKAPNLDAECARINDLIDKNGGLDVMLVGVGTNGHIGMNEPGTPFTSVAHVSVLAEETKTVGQKYFDRATALSHGITLGLRHLQEARLPLVVANGSRKAAILAQALKGPATEKIPVSIVHQIPHAWVMLDQEAAALL